MRAVPRNSRWLARAPLGAAVLIVVFVIGLLRAGSSYFVCAQMGAVSSAPCCQHCDSGREQTPAISRAPCCAREQIRAASPALTPSSHASIPSAALLATIEPAYFAADAALARAIDPGRAFSRDGPPHADPRAARSMVFLL